MYVLPWSDVLAVNTVRGSLYFFSSVLSVAAQQVL